jgi:2-iminobutanoate/2-iminopropanoate deaminase
VLQWPGGASLSRLEAELAKREIIRPAGVAANRILSPGVRVGDFIWTAGHVGRDPATGTMPEDIRGQTRQTLENLKAVLEAGGSSLSSVIKVNIYLKEIADRDAANEVYVEFFPTDPPGRTAIGGAQFGPGVLIEIEAVAVVQ